MAKAGRGPDRLRGIGTTMAGRHLSRRGALACACCGVAAGMLPFGRPSRAAGEHPAAPAMSPDEALALLKEGNARFVADAPFAADIGQVRRHELAKGQQPFAVVVGCSDSRVPPELLFGRGLGELFVIRVAGNTVDLAAEGSIEYAVAELGAPLVMVLGHERCGAVSAAVSVVEHNAIFPGAISDIVLPIVPAVLKAKAEPGDLLDNSVRQNVLRTVKRLRALGPILPAMVEAGRVKVVGGRYDLDDGKVDFLAEG